MRSSEIAQAETGGSGRADAEAGTGGGPKGLNKHTGVLEVGRVVSGVSGV